MTDKDALAPWSGFEKRVYFQEMKMKCEVNAPSVTNTMVGSETKLPQKGDNGIVGVQQKENNLTKPQHPVSSNGAEEVRLTDVVVKIEKKSSPDGNSLAPSTKSFWGKMKAVFKYVWDKALCLPAEGGKLGKGLLGVAKILGGFMVAALVTPALASVWLVLVAVGVVAAAIVACLSGNSQHPGAALAAIGGAFGLFAGLPIWAAAAGVGLMAAGGKNVVDQIKSSPANVAPA